MTEAYPGATSVMGVWTLGLGFLGDSEFCKKQSLKVAEFRSFLYKKSKATKTDAALFTENIFDIFSPTTTPVFFLLSYLSSLVSLTLFISLVPLRSTILCLFFPMHIFLWTSILEKISSQQL